MTTDADAPRYAFPGEADCEHFNRAAVFDPRVDHETLPCLDVAGVVVFAYLDAELGAVRVSVDLDTADPAVVRPDGTVPLRVTVGDSEVFDDSGAARPPAAARSGPPPSPSIVWTCGGCGERVWGAAAAAAHAAATSEGRPCPAYVPAPLFVVRSPWRDRLMFNCWRRPLPYLLHRWEVTSDLGPCHGFFTRRGARAYVAEYEALPDLPETGDDE